MALETASYISQLVATNPTASDPKSQGDNHLRMVKTVLQTQFPNFGTTAITATAAELNYSVGVTSAIQTQINTKAPTASPTFTGTVTIPAGAVIDGFAPLASPALTGTPTAPTATAGTSTTQLATTAFVQSAAFAAALPSQTGNAGKYVTTDGTNASWAETVTSVNGRTGVVTGVQDTLVSGATIKTIGGVSVLGYGDLPVGAWVLLSTITASGSATVDIETTFSSTYDNYVIVASGINPATNNVNFQCLLKLGGSYAASGYLYHSGESSSSGTTWSARASSSDSSILIKGGSQFDNTSSSSLSLTMFIRFPSSTALKKVIDWHGVLYRAVPAVELLTGAAGNTSTSALTGVRFQMSAGNIASGTFRLYGVKNS